MTSIVLLMPELQKELAFIEITLECEETHLINLGFIQKLIIESLLTAGKLALRTLINSK